MSEICDYNSKTNTFYLTPGKPEIVFKNKTHLIHTIARYIDKNNSDDPNNWLSNWINRQNMTGTDIVVYTNEYNEPVYTAYRDLWFHTEDNKTIDIRNFWPEIVKTVRAIDSGMIKPYPSPIKRFYWKRHGIRPTSHTYSNYRYNIRIGRLAKFATAVYDYEDENYKIHLRPRGRDLEMKTVWWDDFGRRNSTGWKTKKYKKQWEHNVATKFFHDQNKARKLNKKTIVSSSHSRD